MRKIKLLYLSDYAYPGGAEKILLNIAKIIPAVEYEPIFLFGEDGVIRKEIDKLGYKTFVIKLPNLISWEKNKIFIFLNLFIFLKPFLNILFFINKNKFDYIITNTIKFEIIGSLASKLLKKKLIWHTHNIQPNGFRKKFISLFANCFPIHIIAVSNAVKESFKNSKSYAKISVVENGIEIKNVEKRCNSTKFLNNKKFTILMLSVLTSWKGHFVLIDALNILEKNNQIKNIKVLIGGDAYKPKDKIYKKKLINYSKKFIENGVLTFLGEVNNIDNYLKISDVLVCPSIHPDPFPTVLLEALRYGIPCIATKIGGQPEIINHGKNGLLIEPNNPKQLANAILFCLKNPQMMEAFSKQSIIDFNNKFTLEKFKDRYLSILRCIIK